MKESLLLKIKDSVNQYANVIASVLNVDVDIADNNLIRIAGTGRFAHHILMYFNNEGNAFRKVLQTKKSLFIDNPKVHEVCIGCKNIEICIDQCEVCCPIIVKDEVIGVISLASSTESQKLQICENISDYLAFLEKIADLIATKVLEYINYEEQAFMIELLNRLMNLINDGVIIFDDDNSILYMNRKTELLLGNNLSQLRYLRKIKQFSIHKIKNTNNMTDVEYLVKVKERKVRLSGSIYPITIGIKEVSRVFIFQDIISLQQNMLKVNHVDKYNFNYLIGKSENFLKIKEQCRRLSSGDKNILICGETGTGKEMFARAIHNESMRKNNPFITVVCSGTVDTIIEKEIFGYSYQFPDDKGIGKIEISAGGTLFIDEISDLSLRLQGRLVNVINQADVNTRIIATTNKDLRRMVDVGEFRKDLYYSLEAFTVTIPPLRSRQGDIILLANYFLDRYNCLEGKDVVLKEEVYKVFINYPWAGNVRELENIISFIVHTNNSSDPVSIEDLPSNIQNKLVDDTTGQYNLDKIEKQIIVNALNAFGNSTEAKIRVAKELGISKATLYRKLQKYSIVELVHFDSQNET
ncbi:MAG: ATPase, T2SS/T4P/T4SS family [Clostridia bacterium]